MHLFIILIFLFIFEANKAHNKLTIMFLSDEYHKFMISIVHLVIFMFDWHFIILNIVWFPIVILFSTLMTLSKIFLSTN